MGVEDTFDWEESVWNPEFIHFLGWDKKITILDNMIEISFTSVVNLIPCWWSVPLELKVLLLLWGLGLLVKELNVNILGWNVLILNGLCGSSHHKNCFHF